MKFFKNLSYLTSGASFLKGNPCQLTADWINILVVLGVQLGTKSTAGIISLLTHICICVVLNTLVHAQLTYGHQSPCH